MGAVENFDINLESLDVVIPRIQEIIADFPQPGWDRALEKRASCMKRMRIAVGDDWRCVWALPLEMQNDLDLFRKTSAAFLQHLSKVGLKLLKPDNAPIEFEQSVDFFLSKREIVLQHLRAHPDQYELFLEDWYVSNADRSLIIFPEDNKYSLRLREIIGSPNIL